LQNPQSAQHLPHPVDTRGRRRPGQVLAPDGQPPCLPQAQHEVIRHSPILQDPGTERAAVPPLRRQQRRARAADAERTIRLDEVTSSGDLGYALGVVVVRIPSGRELSTKYATIWQRDADGRWRLAVDSSSPNP